MNRLTIIGNLTKDPAMRTTQSGHNVCGFTVAVNRRQKDQNGQLRNGYLRQGVVGKGFSYLHGQRCMPERRSRKGGKEK